MAANDRQQPVRPPVRATRPRDASAFDFDVSEPPADIGRTDVADQVPEAVDEHDPVDQEQSTEYLGEPCSDDDPAEPSDSAAQSEPLDPNEPPAQIEPYDQHATPEPTEEPETSA